ncbi:MAG: CRISPR-associated CARF protein Csx1 [Thermodesulfobacteriaceae bacterium]|jgi:CRISPR-associated protein Csx1
MKLIYQIGRLERGAFNPIKFEVHGKVYEALLSSFALRQSFLENKQASKVILIYPVSLLLNRNALQIENIPENFKLAIESILNNKNELSNYLSNPYPYFEKHPHSKEANGFIVIHSIGQYEGVKFSSTLEELILEIFIDMVKRYQDEPFSELYLDISSGHNIYTSALLEAGRLFLTFYKLQNFNLKENGLKVFITFSDPIVQPYDRTFQVHKDFCLEVKTFFSFPEKPTQNRLDNAYSKFAKDLIGDDKELRPFKRQLNELFSYGYFFYSAIKNNCPLVLYTWEYHQEEEIDKGIVELINFVTQRLYSNYQSTPGLRFDLFRKAFLMLSIYKGMVKVLKNYDIFKKEEVEIGELARNFKDEKQSFYNCFELQQNREYFSHEFSNTFEKEEIKNNIPEYYVPLRKLIKGESDEIKPRNFIAHCGFERNCVYVRRQEARVFVKYGREVLSRIEEILLSSKA